MQSSRIKCCCFQCSVLCMQRSHLFFQFETKCTIHRQKVLLPQINSNSHTASMMMMMITFSVVHFFFSKKLLCVIVLFAFYHFTSSHRFLCLSIELVVLCSCCFGSYFSSVYINISKFCYFVYFISYVIFQPWIEETSFLCGCVCVCWMSCIHREDAFDCMHSIYTKDHCLCHVYACVSDLFRSHSFYLQNAFSFFRALNFMRALLRLACISTPEQQCITQKK